MMQAVAKFDEIDNGRELRLSISQVAKQAGVSTATVSRVLSGSEVRIAPATRHHVQTIADSLGYIPNGSARALATGYTQTLALWGINMNSTFSAQVIYQMNRALVQHHYAMMIAGTQSDCHVTRLMSWPIDGILALDLAQEVTDSLDGSLLYNKPFTAIGGYVSDVCDHVWVDFRSQVIEAVRHLHSVGCRRIAYLVPAWFEWFHQTSDARLAGYKEGVYEIGCEPEFIITPAEHKSSVAEALTDYIERKGCPDGLFCFNDEMAIGAFRTLRDLGRRIPEDVALVGCDGIDEANYLEPRLTTIVQPVEQMCVTAWEFVERRIQNNNIPLQQTTIQPRLEIRASSCR